MPESLSKIPFLGWVAALAAFGLGLVLVCLCGAGLALIVQTGPAASTTGAVSTVGAGPNGALEATVALTATLNPGDEQPATPQPFARVGEIPLPEGVRQDAAVGQADQFSVLTQLPFDQVVAFYQSVMPEQGWNPLEKDSYLTERAAELYYEKGGQTAALVIARIPFVGTLISLKIIEG